jgi:hypothetical protein
MKFTLSFKQLAALSLFTLGTHQQSVSTDELRHYARFTGIAYCPSTAISTLQCNICNFDSKVMVHQVFDPNGDFQAYVATDPAKRAIVVTFRGTLTINNMATNLNLGTSAGSQGFSSAYPNARVHSGFVAYYNTLQSQLGAKVSELLKSNPGYEVVFTGHSQGGAIATIAALDSKSTYLKSTPVSLITFGEPRIGNQEFVNALAKAGFKKSYRVTHAKDPVPQVPLRDENLNVFPPFIRVAPLSYVHRKNEIFIEPGQKSIKQCNDGQGEDPNCSLGQYNLAPSSAFLLTQQFANNVMPYHLNYLGIPQAGLGLGCEPN